MKFTWTIFIEDDTVDFFDILVREIFPFLTTHPFVLPQQQVSRVAGGTLTGKGITNFLAFDIRQTVVLKLHNDVNHSLQIMF